MEVKLEKPASGEMIMTSPKKLAPEIVSQIQTLVSQGETTREVAPASTKMLNWQLRKLIGQLLLLQDHALSTDCPCETDDTMEYCIPKTLLAIQAYAEETILMTDNHKLKDLLTNIAGAADDLSRAYQEAPEDKRPYSDIATFARDARKELEPFLWQYKQSFPNSTQGQPKLLSGVAMRQERRWCYKLKGGKCYTQDELDDLMLAHDPEMLERLRTPGETISLEEMRKELKTGGEVKMADPLLAEITKQICSTGICLAKSKKKSKLPICTASQKKARESCIRQLKPRQKAGELKSAYGICTAAIGCRPGRKGKIL